MKELKSVLEAEQRAEEILQKKARFISSAEEQIKQAKQDEEQAREEMTKAVSADDAKAYLQAKRKLSDAGEIVEMMESKISRLKEDPAISDDEKAKLLGHVRLEVAELENETKKKLAEYSLKMRETAAELFQAQEQANRICRKIRKQLCGETGYSEDVDCWRTIRWGADPGITKEYEDYTGERINRAVFGSQIYAQLLTK